MVRSVLESRREEWLGIGVWILDSGGMAVVHQILGFGVATKVWLECGGSTIILKADLVKEMEISIENVDKVLVAIEFILKKLDFFYFIF